MNAGTEKANSLLQDIENSLDNRWDLSTQQQGHVNTISKLIIIDHKRSNYMKTMADEVLEELTKNAMDYGLMSVIKKLPRRTILKAAINKTCGNTQNHYRELVSDHLFNQMHPHEEPVTRQHLQETQDSRTDVSRHPSQIQERTWAALKRVHDTHRFTCAYFCMFTVQSSMPLI